MKYLQKQLNQHKGKIVWLASYPKSGNTWFRCFISALFKGEIDLAHLKTDGIFSLRHTFERYSGIDSRMLNDKEVHAMISSVFLEHAKNSQHMLFTKAHDAYIYNDNQQPIFPTEVTHKAVYLVRNPLDIVASLANHNATTKDKAIELMNNPKGYLGGQVKGINTNSQFRQLMFDWSGHVKSWNEQKNIEVILVRYEDMLHDSFNTFKNVVQRLEIKASDTAIKKAVKMSSFKKLQKQEKEKGFREKNVRSEKFFRSGKTGQFEKELSPTQIQNVIDAHQEQMKQLNYL